MGYRVAVVGARRKESEGERKCDETECLHAQPPDEKRAHGRAFCRDSAGIATRLPGRSEAPGARWRGWEVMLTLRHRSAIEGWFVIGDKWSKVDS